MNNKYNSLTETFTSYPILNAVLSTLAVPPADMALTAGDFTTQFLYSTSGDIAAAAGRIKFAINDKPRIIGFGLFCNLADGLVYMDNPDTFINGPSFNITLKQYDAANAYQGQIDNAQAVRCPELNQIWDADRLFDVSLVNTALDSLRIEISMATNTMTFSTISVNPDFAAKRIIFRPVVVIEHTFPVTAV